MISISKGKYKVEIENGELRSYKAGGYEYMHQKGSPGWGSTDTEMFPVIGPTAAATYRIQVPRGNAIQDQHGLFRELEYQQERISANEAVFLKTYKAGTPVKNSKYPDRSEAQWLVWPYDFSVKKAFVLSDQGLEIRFAVRGEKDMPFMFGYHPAFQLRTSQPSVKAGGQQIGLEEVLAVGSRALLVEGLQEVILQDERKLKIKTSGFGDFMLWTEVSNMICIEPITFYPYSIEQHELHKGFEYLGEEERNFSVILQPVT